MTTVQEVLLRVESDYAGHPYYVTGHALYQALARRVDAAARQALHVSHGVFLPGEWGRWPEWHPREGSMGKASTGLRAVESYADFVVYRDAAHRWLNDDRPRDAHNALPVRSHGGRVAVAPRQHFGRPPEQRNHKRTVEWFVHCYLHARGASGVVPLADDVLDGLRVGGARNYGFGATRLVDTQVIDLAAMEYAWLREADAHRLEVVSPYVLTSEYPGADAQSVPWWWAVSGGPGTTGASDVSPDGREPGGLRCRDAQLVDGADVYRLRTIDHGQVVGYAGDDPVATARNGVLRVGTHARYGFGELRVRPASADRVAERSEAQPAQPAGAGEGSG